MSFQFSMSFTEILKCFVILGHLQILKQLYYSIAKFDARMVSPSSFPPSFWEGWGGPDLGRSIYIFIKKATQSTCVAFLWLSPNHYFI